MMDFINLQEIEKNSLDFEDGKILDKTASVDTLADRMKIKPSFCF